jgi:hypothetical protein
MLNFELLPNWKDIAKKAWSMWGNYVTMILAGMETVSVVFLNGTPSATMVIAVFVITSFSTGARLVSQNGLSKGVPIDMNTEDLAELAELIVQHSQTPAPVDRVEQ